MGKGAGGRPAMYEDRFAEMAETACREGGLTDLQLGKLFGVTKTTINNWKKEHPEFLDSIKRGKDDYDSGKIEKSLAKRANGFRYTETTREPVYDSDGNKIKGMTITKKVSKVMAPDPTAIIFWLTNRDPSRWRKKQEIGITSTPTLEINVTSPNTSGSGQQNKD